jgi:hypothetical protein
MITYNTYALELVHQASSNHYTPYWPSSRDEPLRELQLNVGNMHIAAGEPLI